MIGKDGELIAEFGKDVPQIELTENEMEQKVQRAGRISSNPSRLAASSAFKPIFINIAIDENGTIWAHRNKKYGSREELDVYTLNGEYITTVTLPPSGNEYRMLEINKGKILFRVNSPDGGRELRVYQIRKG